MGDIADMMLEGDLCQECGEYMPHSMGFPRTCKGCKSAARRNLDGIVCPKCGKKCRGDLGLQQHTAAKHAPAEQGGER